MGGIDPFGPESGPTGEYARLGEQVVHDPDAAWSRLLEITAAVDDAGLFWVVDILEDFVQYHPDRFGPMIEGELEINTRLRQAFVYFAPTTSDDVLADRLLEIRERIEQDG